MRQSISCDDLLQINGGDTNSNGTDFRTELNEIFATRSMMSGSAQSPTLAQVMP